MPGKVRVGSTCCVPFRHGWIALGMPWPQRHQVRLRSFPLILAGLASQHLGERMYGLSSRPYDLSQINQAFMAAPPAAHLEQFAAASNRIDDPGRRFDRPADELPHAPFLAGQPMRGAIGFLDAARHFAMRLLGGTQLANVVPRSRPDSGRWMMRGDIVNHRANPPKREAATAWAWPQPDQQG
jgi:hypothetical protein